MKKSVTKYNIIKYRKGLFNPTVHVQERIINVEIRVFLYWRTSKVDICCLSTVF